MKTIIAILLALHMAMSCGAQTNNVSANPPPQSDPEKDVLACWFLPLLVLTAVVVGVTVIIYVHKTHSPPKEGDKVTVYLKKSPDNVNWSTVASNTITFSTNLVMIELFREDINKDKTAFYKLSCGK